MQYPFVKIDSMHAKINLYVIATYFLCEKLAFSDFASSKFDPCYAYKGGRIFIIYPVKTAVVLARVDV